MKETSEVVADYAIKPLIVPRTVKTYVNFYVDVGVIDRIKLLILPRETISGFLILHCRISVTVSM